jgi:hypothetical protein
VYLLGSLFIELPLQPSIQDPYSRFEFGIKAEETRQKYVRRLDIFFDFYGVEGETIKEKSENFLKYTKENSIRYFR